MTHQAALDFIRRVRWQFAKTMPQWPHWYTIRDWRPDLDEQTTEFVTLIRREGVVKSWPYGAARPRHRNTYLILPDPLATGRSWEYWTIGDDYASEKISVINRCVPGWDSDDPAVRELANRLPE